MNHRLTIHPDFHCDALGSLEAHVARPEGRRLALRYRLTGVTDDLVLPPAGFDRADGLWKHTCFEAFVQAAPDRGYRELNFAAGRWAAYAFEDYRQGMANADLGAPDADLAPNPAGRGFDLLLTWDLDLPADAPWRVGVSAVIEERSGRISYWALRHPPGRPDFHHADGFMVELPAPSAP